MQSIYNVTLPFFALVLCGYAAARRRLLPPSAVPGMNACVMSFALPCMLFRFGAGLPVAQLLDGSLIAVYTACALLMVGLTVVMTVGRSGWNDAAFGALVAAFPNTGFMGVPMLVALLGPAAAGPAIVSITVDMVLTSSLCIALSRMGRSGGQGPAHAARLALRAMLANPLPWAIALGGAASAGGLALPGPVTATVYMLADAAAPAALFTLGAMLARSQAVGTRSAALASCLPIALVKLLLHPLLLAGLGLAAIAAGLRLDRFALTVVVLVGALPSASNIAILAERFGADAGRIARIILISTVLAFVTFPAAVALLAR